MSAPRSALAALAFPIVAPALLPDEAEACPNLPDCEAVPAWVSLELHNAAKIPTDGVLVLTGYRRGEGDPLADLTIEVTKDGQPIAGAFETTASRHALIWRPAEPWEPGASYLVDGTIAIPDEVPYCATEQDIFGGEIFIDSEPAGALGVVEFASSVSEPGYVHSFELDGLACCVGAAAPYYEPVACGEGYVLSWDPEACGTTRTTGSFTLVVMGALAADGPVVDEVLYSVRLDGEVVDSALDGVFGFDLTAPVCVTIEALDLGTMTKGVSEEQCFGQDFADMLGPKTLIPDLGCPLEQCAVVDNTWDGDQCAPYGPEPEPGSDSDTPTSGDNEADDSGSSEAGPDQDGDAGCACASDAAAGGWLPALIVGLGRRRRARAAGAG